MTGIELVHTSAWQRRDFRKVGFFSLEKAWQLFWFAGKKDETETE